MRATTWVHRYTTNYNSMLHATQVRFGFPRALWMRLEDPQHVRYLKPRFAL